MSENSKRAGTPAKRQSKAASAESNETFSARFLKVAEDFGSLIQDAGGIRGLENLIDERSGLQETVRQKDMELHKIKIEATEAKAQHQHEISKLEQEKADIKSSLGLLVEELGTRYQDWSTAKERYETESEELVRLRARFEHSQEYVKEVLTERDNLRDKCDRLVQDITEQRDSNEKLRSKLQRRELKLAEIQSELGKCRNVLADLREKLGIRPLDREKV